MICKSRLDPQAIISLAWDDTVEGEFWADIIIDVVNQRGVLGVIASAIAESDSNIADIHVDPKDGRHNSIAFKISVNNRSHLAKIMRKLRAIKYVSRIYRKKQG